MNMQLVLSVSIGLLLIGGCDDTTDPDAGTDAGNDAASIDAEMMDSSVDVGSDAASDAASDTGADAADSGTDSGPDGGGMMCGNDIVEAPELCDGDCPTECDDSVACTTDMLVGLAEECSATCTFSPITSCMNGDGCCADGCNTTNDDDCSPSCGNGTVEGSEVCDGDCPTMCDDEMACTTDALVGSAASCSAACSFTDVTLCIDDDSCCAPGCDATLDNDCSPSCGNNVTETPEICDGDCPTMCDDSMVCTTDTLMGSAASCDAVCLFSAITACADGDGCCPSMCNSGTDNDCVAPAPVITSVLPSSVALGSTLMLDGTDFLGAVSLTIGGVAQTFTVESSSAINVTVSAATTVAVDQDVLVTTPSGVNAPATVTVLDQLAVVSATSTDGFSVVVTFSRALDPASVVAGDFEIPGLTLSSAVVSGADVTLQTSPQGAGTMYNVTANTLSDTFGNGLDGVASAAFVGTLASVVLTDFASGVAAVNHPAGSGGYDTWYDATFNTFGGVSASTLEGAPAMRIDDGGFTNGTYAIFDSAVPFSGNYRVEVRMHIIEDAAALNGIQAYQIGVASGAAAIHRGVDSSLLAPVANVGDYAGLTAGDDTGAGPSTVVSMTFSATAGDDVLIAFGTDVSSGAWNVGAATFGNSHVIVGDVILIALP